MFRFLPHISEVAWPIVTKSIATCSTVTHVYKMGPEISRALTQNRLPCPRTLKFRRDFGQICDLIADICGNGNATRYRQLKTAYKQWSLHLYSRIWLLMVNSGTQTTQNRTMYSTRMNISVSNFGDPSPKISDPKNRFQFRDFATLLQISLKLNKIL